MIGLKHLSRGRQELFASRCSLDALKPYLLDFYKDAYATIVLYEDNAEVFHDTGIFRFDAADPVTFNYEEFQADLLEEYNDKVAVCTVENLFLHLDRYMEAKPLEDDPFKTLVFSISLAPPSQDLLKDWERNLDKRLKSLFYDVKSDEHFQLFPNEVCVVYSHDNHFTSVTSDRLDLIQAVFEDMVERHLGELCQPPLSPEVIAELYAHTDIYGAVRLKPERLYTNHTGQPFLLVTYPDKSIGPRKLVSFLSLTPDGQPLILSEAQYISRWRYHLRFSDFTLLPMALVVMLMVVAVGAALYFRVLFPKPVLSAMMSPCYLSLSLPA